MSFRAASIKCQACGKTVYAMEAMNADGKTFHKGCMKCAECNGVLKLGNYAAVGGKYYCKPHFKQLFKLKGNYSSGFGGDGGEAASHSFSVPVGRADFNRATPRAGSPAPSTPTKVASPAVQPKTAPSAGAEAKDATPAPASPAPTVTTTPSPTPAPTPTPTPTPAVPQLASPSPIHRTVAPTATPPSLGSSGGGAALGASRGLASSGGGASFENEKHKLEAEKKAFEDEKKRFEEDKKKKEAEHKAALAAAEKELAAAKEAAAAAAAAPKPAEPAKPAPAPVTLSASEQLICDAFSALLADAHKKDLALKKAGLAK